MKFVQWLKRVFVERWSYKLAALLLAALVVVTANIVWLVD